MFNRGEFRFCGQLVHNLRLSGRKAALSAGKTVYSDLAMWIQGVDYTPFMRVANTYLYTAKNEQLTDRSVYFSPSSTGPIESSTKYLHNLFIEGMWVTANTFNGEHIIRRSVL